MAIEERVTVGDGKYTIIHRDGEMSVLRNGEPWDRDLTGDKMVYCLMARILELEAAAVQANLRPAAAHTFVQFARKVIADVSYLDYHVVVRVNDRGTIELLATYMDVDIYTGKPELQTTRHWLLTPAMTASELVSTAFKCCFTSSEHRAREAFKYKGARIFGPHFDVEDLASLCKDGKEDAGGRNPTNNPTL